MSNESRIKYFPVSFFSVIMGLTGFTISIQKGENILGLNNMLSGFLLYVVVAIFVFLTLIYGIKIIKYYPSVIEEISNPVRLSFVPTFSISIILLSVAFLEVSLTISKYLWIFGSALHLIATIAILSQWVWQTKFEINHFNPSWFITIVGNILVPIAGVNHFNIEISWFFYSIGIVFWIPFFAIFLYRIIFHNPLPNKLLPTFFILIAPPALGFVSYVKLTGQVDSFSKILYYFALFMIIFLLAQVKMLSSIKFYLSWWAYSFPIASITVATALMLKETGIEIYKYIFFILILILTAFIITLIFNTLKAASKGEICKKEE